MIELIRSQNPTGLACWINIEGLTRVRGVYVGAILSDKREPSELTDMIVLDRLSWQNTRYYWQKTKELEDSTLPFIV